MHAPKKAAWIGLTRGIGVCAVTLTVLAFLNSIVIVHVLFVSGGAFLAALALDRKRSRRGWARGMLAIAGLVLLLVGSAEFALHYDIWTPSLSTRSSFKVISWTITGLAFGLLLALSVSGELAGQKVSSDSTPTV
jgi:hypothetical protein